MAAAVDVLRFADGKTAPKHEYDAAALLRESLDGGIGEQLPTSMLVRARLMSTHCECGVEQENPLVGPSDEVAAATRD